MRLPVTIDALIAIKVASEIIAAPSAIGHWRNPLCAYCSAGDVSNLQRFFAAYKATGGSTPGAVLVDMADYSDNAQHMTRSNADRLVCHSHGRRDAGREDCGSLGPGRRLRM